MLKNMISLAPNRPCAVQLTLSRSEIASFVCLNSASAAVLIAVSLSATRSAMELALGILVKELILHLSRTKTEII